MILYKCPIPILEKCQRTDIVVRSIIYNEYVMPVFLRELQLQISHTKVLMEALGELIEPSVVMQSHDCLLVLLMNQLQIVLQFCFGLD